MALILVIDDDALLIETIKLQLLAAAHAVTTAGDGVEAAKLFRAKPFDLITG